MSSYSPMVGLKSIQKKGTKQGKQGNSFEYAH